MTPRIPPTTIRWPKPQGRTRPSHLSRKDSETKAASLTGEDRSFCVLAAGDLHPSYLSAVATVCPFPSRFFWSRNEPPLSLRSGGTLSKAGSERVAVGSVHHQFVPDLRGRTRTRSAVHIVVRCAPRCVLQSRKKKKKQQQLLIELPGEFIQLLQEVEEIRPLWKKVWPAGSRARRGCERNSEEGVLTDWCWEERREEKREGGRAPQRELERGRERLQTPTRFTDHELTPALTQREASTGSEIQTSSGNPGIIKSLCVCVCVCVCVRARACARNPNKLQGGQRRIIGLLLVIYLCVTCRLVMQQWEQCGKS